MTWHDFTTAFGPVEAVLATLIGVFGVGFGLVKWRAQRKSEDRTAGIQQRGVDASDESNRIALTRLFADANRELIARVDQLELQRKQDKLDCAEAIAKACGDVRSAAEFAAREQTAEHESQLQRVHHVVTMLRTEVDNNATALATQASLHRQALADKDREFAQRLADLLAEKDRQIEALRAEIDVLRQQIGRAGADLQGGVTQEGAVPG